MTLNKLLTIKLYKNGVIKYRIRYGHDITNVIKSDNYYISEEWGQIMTPVYDSTTNELIGFIDA